MLKLCDSDASRGREASEEAEAVATVANIVHNFKKLNAIMVTIRLLLFFASFFFVVVVVAWFLLLFLLAFKQVIIIYF